MSYYNQPLSLYDILQAFEDSRAAPQARAPPQRYPIRPNYYYPEDPQQYAPRYRQPQNYYYNDEDSNTAEERSDFDADADAESDDPRGVLYRSLYGDAPYYVTHPRQHHAHRHRSHRPKRVPYDYSYPEQQQEKELASQSQAEPVITLGDLIASALGAGDTTAPGKVSTALKGSIPQEPKKQLSNKAAKEEGKSESEASVPGSQPSSGKEPASEPQSSQAPKPVSRKPSAFNLHKSAPSPPLDSFQVSKPQLRKSKPFSPPINVYDLKEKYVVVVSLPGADKSSFHIDFHPTSHELLIKGEVKNKYYHESSDDESYLKISEQRFGSFERTIKLPTLPRVEDENIKATYSNGLLELVIPKITPDSHEKVKRRIDIEEVEDEELRREANGGFLV
ncbi:BA75_04314T0 [Komagataella pastoris]|uniref:BA75_04314T0 n=1 Tax=Komagataella pastoris TaxID=4922 RepID=A0A1B2JFC8_PICPA|nr:BA75_04314T0 [Komagataella pastoris]